MGLHPQRHRRKRGSESTNINGWLRKISVLNCMEAMNDGLFETRVEEEVFSPFRDFSSSTKI